MYKDYFNDRFENEVKFQEKMKDNSFLSSLELSADASDEIVKGLVFLNLLLMLRKLNVIWT